HDGHHAKVFMECDVAVEHKLSGKIGELDSNGHRAILVSLARRNSDRILEILFIDRDSVQRGHLETILMEVERVTEKCAVGAHPFFHGIELGLKHDAAGIEYLAVDRKAESTRSKEGGACD